MNTNLGQARNRILVIVSMIVLVFATLVATHAARAVDLLENPISSFSFAGNLSGEMGDVFEVLEDFSVPITLPNQSLPFTSQSNETTAGGHASASYSINITSDFLPAFDTLNLQLDLSVSGIVTGSWGTWSGADSDLSGRLVTEFEVLEWSSAQFDLSAAWAFFDDVELNYNIVNIVGPLNPSRSSQSGYLFEMTMSAPNDWFNFSGTNVVSNENLVPGIYEIIVDASVTSFPYRSGSNSSSAAMDLQNDIAVAILNTISPVGCEVGVPCPNLADIDGVNGVNLADFVLWYQGQIDVTSDGQTGVADEAAMAYLLGLEMVDDNDNGMVDAVDAYLLVAGVDQNTAPSAKVQLHAAYPNPFNPKTILSFTLGSDQVVDLAIFDVKGNLVRTLLTADHRGQGLHEVAWNGRDDTGRVAPAGTYLYRLNGGGSVYSGRMLLLK